MPGFIAGVYVSPADKVGVAALTNSSTRAPRPARAEARRGDRRRWPVPPEPWRWRSRRPTTSCRCSASGSWRATRSSSGGATASSRRSSRTPPTGRRPPCFVRESDDRWRVVSGWEHGEVLRIEPRRGMVLAGYPVTREPTRVGADLLVLQRFEHVQPPGAPRGEDRRDESRRRSRRRRRRQRAPRDVNAG